MKIKTCLLGGRPAPSEVVGRGRGVRCATLPRAATAIKRPTSRGRLSAASVAPRRRVDPIHGRGGLGPQRAFPVVELLDHDAPQRMRGVVVVAQPGAGLPDDRVLLGPLARRRATRRGTGRGRGSWPWSGCGWPTSR